MGGVAAALSPVPAGQAAVGFHITFATSLFNGILYGGSIVLLLMALGSFKAHIRVAYITLCVGQALVAIGALQYIAISYFNLYTTPYMMYGWSEAPFLIGLFLLYFGPWLIARRVGVKNIWTSLPLVVGTILGVALLSLLIHHSPDPDIEKSTDLLIAFNIWEMSFGVVGVMVLLSLKRALSVLYTPAFAWLILLYGFIVFGDLQLITVLLIAGNDNWFINYNVTMLTYMLGAFSGLKSGIAFKQNTYSDDLPIGIMDKVHRSFFGTQKAAIEGQQISCGEVIVSLAALVSNPRMVDDKLDRLRGITAMSPDGKNLPDADQVTLGELYLWLENYLATQETARKFSAEKLRFMVASKYRHQVDAPVFWQTIESKPPAAAQAAAA